MRYCKFSLLAAVLLLLCLLLALGVNAEATSSQIVFAAGETVVFSADTALAAGELTVPAYTPEDGRIFVGWQAAAGEETLLLPAGAAYTYEANAELSFSPLCISMTTASGATLRFDESGAGLRFHTTVSLADWQTLTALATVARGTLIVPYSYLADMENILTHASLAAAEKLYIDVPAEAWYAEEEGTAAFSGAVTAIRFENYTRGYTAVGYLKLTYSDGSEAYLYAAPEGGRSFSVSPWKAAYAAFLDTADAADDRYRYLVGSAYSPYSEEERAALSVFMEAVIALAIDESIAGGKTVDTSVEAFGQRAYTQIIITENDEGWQSIRSLVGSKATGALLIRAADGSALDATTLSGVVLNLRLVKGVVMPYVVGENCILISYSDYTENY